MEQQYFTEEDSMHNIPQYHNTETNPELIEPILAAINVAFQTEGAVEGVQVAAGRVYTRKTETAFDKFGGDRNPAYRSDSDDYYFQIGVRVSYHRAEVIETQVAALEDVSKAARIKELRSELGEAEVIKRQVDAQQADLLAELNQLENPTN